MIKKFFFQLICMLEIFMIKYYTSIKKGPTSLGMLVPLKNIFKWLILKMFYVPWLIIVYIVSAQLVCNVYDQQ
jgi:hypothetical protein